MLKLIEIQSHACSNLVHHGFAATWSENNQIAMITEKGVQILELRFNPHNKSSTIDCHRSALETSDRAPTDHIGINAVNIIYNSDARDVSALILNPDWAPGLDKTLPLNKVVVQTVWSPRGVLQYGRCLLACLTNMGQLTLYGAERARWVEKVDVSKVWLRYCRRRWPSKSSKANMKHQISELQYRASRIKYTAVAWERFHGDECSCSTLLITASLDGIVGLWIVEDENYKSNLNLEPITMLMADGIKVKLMKVFDSKLTNITSFLWCCIDSTSGVLIAGNVKGAINSIRINFCDASKANMQQVPVENMECDQNMQLKVTKSELGMQNDPNSGCLVSDNQPNLTSEVHNLTNAHKMEDEPSKSEAVELGVQQNDFLTHSGCSVDDNQPNLTSGVQPNLTTAPKNSLEAECVGGEGTSEVEPNLTSMQEASIVPGSVTDEGQASEMKSSCASETISNLGSGVQNISEIQTSVPSAIQPDVAHEPDSNLTSEIQHNLLTEAAQPGQTCELKSNTTSETQPDVSMESEPISTTEKLSNTTSDPQPLEAQDNQTSEVQPNLTSEPQPNRISVPQSTLITEGQTNLTSEPQSNLTSEPQSTLTTAGQTNLTSEPNLTSESHPNLTSEPQPNPTTEPQPNLTSVPQSNPNSNPPVSGNVEISVESLWPEEDLLSVSSLICWDADNNNVCAVCIKGTHIIVLILRKDNGKLVSKHCHNTRRTNLTGLIKLNNAAFLIGSQRGAIFKLTLVQDDTGEVTFLNETVQTNFIKNRYGVMGLAASRNRAFIAVNVSLNGPYDHSKLKTLSSFVISSFENTEIDPVAVASSKNFVNLDRVWDCLENARLNILQKSIIYIVPPTIREQLDTMDINPLIITMWLTHFVAYSLQLEQMESGIEFAVENKSQTMTKLFDEIKLLVFSSHVFQRCSNLLYASQLTQFDLRSVALMRSWIASLVALDDIHANTKLTATSILEQIDHKQLPLPQREACAVCDADVPALTDFSVSTCAKGHQIPRCSLSLVQIPSEYVYLHCPRCSVLVHPQAGNFATCVFCNDQLIADENQMTEEDIRELKGKENRTRKHERRARERKVGEDHYNDSEEERILKKRKKKSKKKS